MFKFFSVVFLPSNICFLFLPQLKTKQQRKIFSFFIPSKIFAKWPFENDVSERPNEFQCKCFPPDFERNVCRQFTRNDLYLEDSQGVIGRKERVSWLVRRIMFQSSFTLKYSYLLSHSKNDVFWLSSKYDYFLWLCPPQPTHQKSHLIRACLSFSALIVLITFSFKLNKCHYVRYSN